MNFTKISGWVLLALGLLIIGWTLYSSYGIFTGKAEMPKLFKITGQEAQAPAVQGKLPTTQAELQEEMGKMMGEQLKLMLPLDVIPKMLNLFAWSMLAGILILGGAQIGGLGIKLIK